VKKLVIGVVGVLVAALLYVGFSLWYHLLRVEPQAAMNDPAERYFYGTIGAEVEAGMPRTVFDVAPQLCADLMPGGYRSFGWVYQPGHDLPVGLAQKTIGFPRVSFNCATCHHGTVRTAPDAEPIVIPGMPPSRLDFQRHVHFLFDCLGSDRFTADTAIPAIERLHPLSFLERLFYRYLIIPKTKQYIATLSAENSWHRSRPNPGPGRYDAMNTLRKYFGAEPNADQEIGVADLPPIWHEAAQAKGNGMWDGSSRNLSERNLIAALLAGATPSTIDRAEMSWIETWLSTLPAPKFPFPIDEPLAAHGHRVYEAECARCHGGRVGELSPFAEIGTDQARANTMNAEAIALLAKFDKGHLTFRHFTDTHDYRIPSLEGTWASAPYLHNGSVPSMRALLAPPAERPKSFYRGYDVYDPKDLGFITTGAEASKHGVLLDTAFKGNGNLGHDYGTQLDEDSKNALIEFLKKV
jgi:hypothetical protein